jgi:uncharacterized protein
LVVGLSPKLRAVRVGGEFLSFAGDERVMTTLGVISDTHGLLRPEAVEGLRGASLILHAGDVGAPEVLTELRRIAPVTVVRGNVDQGAWAEAIPYSDVVEVDGASIYMLHILDKLNLKPEAAGFAVVVYGHSHAAKSEVKNGVLYFNPGSAGPRRFKLPVTVGKLVVEGGKVRGEIIELS